MLQQLVLMATGSLTLCEASYRINYGFGTREDALAKGSRKISLCSSLKTMNIHPFILSYTDRQLWILWIKVHTTSRPC